MLQPNSFKESNWVSCYDPKRRSGSKNYYCQITWRHLREIQLNETNGEEYSPIPLSLEILHKCNWNEGAEPGVFYHPKFGDYLILKKGERGYDTILLQNNAYVGEPMQYLHQLQNRYYGLVFEEMEVQL
jgi:hypothetical protein